MRDLAAGRRVLNTFAYTCSFSVAAAIGGAATTVSVDLWAPDTPTGVGEVSRPTAWRQRPRLHPIRGIGLPDAGQATKSGELDLIILDPPTFARSKKPQRGIIHQRRPRSPDSGKPAFANPGRIMPAQHQRPAIDRSGFLKEWLADEAGERHYRILAIPDCPPSNTTQDIPRACWCSGFES